MDVDAAIAAFAARRHGVVHRSEAHRLGLSDRQIRHRVQAGRWTRLHAHVFLLAPALPTVEARALAAAVAVGNGAVVSGCTALFLVGILEKEPAGPVELLTRHRVTLRGVACCVDPNLPSRPKVFSGKIPIAPMHVSLFCAARSLEESALGRAIEDARRRGMKLYRLERTMERLGGMGSKGTAALRRQMALRVGRVVTDSEMEELFLPHLLRRGLQPKLQFPIYEEGRYVRRGDFVIPEAKVDGETDGYEEHGRLTGFAKDRTVDRILMKHGWAVPRFTYWDVVERPDEAADEFLELVERRRAEFAPS